VYQHHTLQAIIGENSSMNINPIKTIYKFNEEANLLLAGYTDERECAFPIEEALEGFDTNELALVLGVSPESSPKDLSRRIMNFTINPSISDVDRMDKHLDSIVFAFGSLFKLGLTPQQAMQGLEVVMATNMKKLHAGKDEAGKQLKGDNFVGPEEELQKILDKR